MSQDTISEILFGQFCRGNRIPCLRITEQGCPDYWIKCRGNKILVEVKEVGESPDERERRKQLESSGTTGVFEPKLGDRVRGMINDAMTQLRIAKGRFPAVIVLYDNVSMIPIDSIAIRIGMYGQDLVDIYVIDRDGDPKVFGRHRFGRGQKVSKQHNTTLSAVGLLNGQSAESLGLNFYHNAFAAKPFNPDWLRIDTVTHYRLSSQISVGGLREWEEF